MKQPVFLLLIIAMLLAGCGMDTQKKPSSPQPQHTSQTNKAQINRDVSELAVTLVSQDERIDEATAVSVDNELSVGLKVSNFNRLRLNTIRKDVHQKLKQHFPKQQVHVTTDSQLFVDLKKLQAQIRQNNKLPSQKVRQQLQKINSDMKG